MPMRGGLGPPRMLPHSQRPGPAGGRRKAGGGSHGLHRRRAHPASHARNQARLGPKGPPACCPPRAVFHFQRPLLHDQAQPRVLGSGPRSPSGGQAFHPRPSAAAARASIGGDCWAIQHNEHRPTNASALARGRPPTRRSAALPPGQAAGSRCEWGGSPTGCPTPTPTTARRPRRSSPAPWNR